MASDTKAVLAASLKELIKHQTLNQITIQNITDQCNLNRQTFYYHFQDIYDLLEWMVQRELDLILKERTNFENWHDVIRYIFSKMLANKSIYYNFYQSVDITWARTLSNDFVHPLVETALQSYVADKSISPEDFNFLVDYFSLIILSVTLQWFADGMPEDREKALTKFFAVMDGSIDWALDHFSTNF